MKASRSWALEYPVGGIVITAHTVVVFVMHRTLGGRHSQEFYSWGH